MERASGFPSKSCGNTRSYRRWMCSDIKKGKTRETDYDSVKKRSQNRKRQWNHFTQKPRSKRKRSSECWANRVYKDHKVSEDIGTTEESRQVQRTGPASCGLQGLEDGARKLRLRIRLPNPLLELEEGEIPPSPGPENDFVLTASDNNDLGERNREAEACDVLVDKKEPSTSTGGTAIVVESDTDSDVVQLIGQKGVTSYGAAGKSTNVEKSPPQNDQICDSVARPPEDRCGPSDEVAMVDHPDESGPACSIMNTQTDREAVTPVCSESHARFTGNHTSVAPLHTSTVERVSIPCNQVYGLHSFHEPGSRTNVQDFGSMASGLTSMNDSFRANLVIPHRAQLPCGDPLQNEMERLKKDHEQELKMHEARMLHMKSKRDEDIEEVLKKYEILFQDAEAALQHKTVDFHAKFQKAYLSKLLATAVMLKHNSHEEALTPETGRAASDNINHLVPNPTQIYAYRLDQWPSVIAPSTVVINEASQVPPRPCSGGLMDCSTILYRNVYESRAAAPHLLASSSQPFSASRLFPVINNGEFIQHLPRYSHNN